MTVSLLHRSVFRSLLVALSATPTFALRAQDTIRIQSTTPPRWGNDIRLAPVLSIGKADGPSEYAFGRIAALAVDTRGIMYLYDESEKQIRSYDAAGKFLRRIGRKGSGPGEYLMVAGMEIVQDSFVVIFDPSNARLTLFTPAGKVFRTISDPRASGWRERSLGVDRNNIISVVVSRGGEMDARAGGRGGAIRDFYLRFRVDGTHLDSLPVPLLAQPMRGKVMTAFLPLRRQAPYSGGGALWADDATMRFAIKPPVGPVRVVERSWNTITVHPDERKELQARGEYLITPDRSRGVTYQVPLTKPALRDIFSDPDGRIWLSVYAAAENLHLPPRPVGDKSGPVVSWKQRPTFEVFDGSSSYLGRVILPAGTSFLYARGNKVWFLGKGEDDEEKVFVMQMSGVR